MEQILSAMKDGSLSIAVTKKDGHFTITIIPKVNELEPILIEGDLDTVIFDLDNTNLAKAISTATDLETIVATYTKAAEKKTIDVKKAATTPTPTPATTTAAKGKTDSKVAPKVEEKKVVKEEDSDELNMFS